MPQPPHITSLHAQPPHITPLHAPNRPTLLHYMPQTAPHYSITCPTPPHITQLMPKPPDIT
jgi:hypothetical protein